MLCKLDAKVERPELRKFSSDPIDTVKADRGTFVVAALTVLRAYHVAGRPNAPTPLGSFEDWSGWVRGALLWLGAADPVVTMEEARGLDPRLDALNAVITQWRAHIERNAVSVREIIEHATRQRTALGGGSPAHPKLEFCFPDFREALLAIAGEGGVINSRRLGKWLAANKDRLVEGACIRQRGLSGGIMQWKLDYDEAAASPRAA